MEGGEGILKEEERECPKEGKGILEKEREY